MSNKRSITFFMMSKSVVGEDGFQLVSRRFSRKKNTKIPLKTPKIERIDKNFDIEALKKKITSAVEDLSTSQYLNTVIKSVSKVLNSKPLVELVCFGLGNFSECPISKYQLSLLLCIINSFNPSKVSVHDPVFYKDECTVLTQFGLHIIEQNNEGRYSFPTDRLSLAFLPHCPKQLTNNFLWSNWNPNLANCILMCNSFRSLCNNQPSRLISETVPYIHKISPYVSETDLDNNFKFPDVFNDIALHIFPVNILESVPANFWDKSEKPSYQDTEEFITSQMIEKLNI